MKRFGLLFLLSASYAGLLTIVFSTDFSRENSFLLPATSPSLAAKAFEAPVLAQNTAISDRITALAYIPSGEPGQGMAAVHGELQSPESADH